MPKYNTLADRPANMLAYPDRIGPTPRNEYLGALADFLARSYAPQRTQQMQGVAQFLGVPAVSQTLDRLSYGEPLTTGAGGVGGTTRVRPEALEAAMTLAPLYRPAGMVAKEAVAMTKGLPVGMSTKAVGGTGFLRPSVAGPQDEALRLAQQRALQMGQSADPATRMLQQGFEPDWYHGTTGDITKFRSDLLGESTGAESAKKGFFFARDPQNPPASMLQKSNSPASIEMLRKRGMSEEEIAKLNTVSMAGHGAETAVGYAKMGGGREYKNAMRQASSAEKRGNWDEYEKQMAIADDFAIKRNQNLQSLVASYGDRRDVMLDEINKAFLNKTLPQEDAIALDKQLKKLMPDYWYTKEPQKHLPSIRAELIKNVGQDKAKPALNAIDNFMKNYNERMLLEHTEEGSNVMPVALRYKNPMVHDFGGSPYRDQTYSDLMDQAIAGGHDALLLKNTFDPGSGPSKLIDVGVVFSPDQIRSRFAAFDPLRKTAATAAAAGLAAPDLLAAERQDNINQMRKLKEKKK
jgi:hypothetical protein